MASEVAGFVVLEAEMRLLKVNALEKGELTDTSFLVGPDGKAEVVHCFKSDLLVASEYFRVLFRSPLTGPPPVRMKHIQPHIFKFVLRYISTNSVEKNLSLEDAVDLAHAADEFLLDSLKLSYLADISKMVRVDNVWKILNRSAILQVKSLCDEVLSTKTRECLSHKSFLEASQASLLHLLQLNIMNIKSENELVDACLKLVNKKPKKEQGAMMKAALPHLRLLTLKVDEIQRQLLDFLSDAEKAYLLTMSKVGAEKRSSAAAIGNLCSNKEPRKCVTSEPFVVWPWLKLIAAIGKQNVDIIPKTKIDTGYAKMFSAKLTTSQGCRMGIDPLFNISLSAIDILTPAKLDPKFTTIKKADGPKGLEMEKVNFTATVTVQYSTSSRVIFMQKVDINQSFNTWQHVEFHKEVAIPSRVAFWISLAYDKEYSFVSISREECALMAAEAEKHKAINCICLENGDTERLNECTCFMIKSIYFAIV